MTAPSVTYSWSRTYPYPYLVVPSTGEPLGFQYDPNDAANPGASISVSGGTALSISAYIDASQATAGGPYFGLFDKNGVVLLSAGQSSGTAGSVGASVTLAASTTAVYPFFDTNNCTVATDGVLVLSEPMVNTGSTHASFTFGSPNLVPDPLFENWFTGGWGRPAAGWLPLSGPLYENRQPSLSASATPGSGASITSWQALLYTAAAYSTPGFVPQQALGLVASATGTGSLPSNLQLPAQLINGQYVPLIQVTQSDSSVSGWVSPGGSIIIDGGPLA